jgi:vancomycin resistance protein YoaR
VFIFRPAVPHDRGVRTDQPTRGSQNNCALRDTTSRPVPAYSELQFESAGVIGSVLLRNVLAIVVVLVALGLLHPARGRPAATVNQNFELVGSFTTHFACCQPRVTNIRRAAQLLDGTLLAPGERFSMNAALGPRTRARGFVPAPMISDGRLVDSVGGGISQLATTLYNAAFFAGLRLVAHTPHSFYISRYPMGREATISWGGPELVFENSWGSPLRMRIRTSATHIAVAFYSSSLGRRVSSWTGKPYAFRASGTRLIYTPALPAGIRRVVQEAGAAGFTIDYGRRVYRFARLISNERWRVRYQPQHRIVEVGTG